MLADHEHIFWNCPKMECYWNNVRSVIKKILNDEIPKISVVLYLGNLTNTQREEDMY